MSISIPSSEDMEQTLERVNTGYCPVCSKKVGIKHLRHSVINHLRRSKDAKHIAWVSRWFKAYFPHGKYAIPPIEAPEYPKKIFDELSKVYSRDMLQQVARIINNTT